MSERRKIISILSTGGTIAMQKTSRGYAPLPGHLLESMAKIPELQNSDMPEYVVEEYETPIDSSNITLEDWHRIGEHIEKNYSKYDGFVILHGTDTMAYTASALSFLLENLQKPVILTGSQLPLFATRSDARDNLINALLMASNSRVPEVCIYFNNKLFRGNRSKKMDAISFAAFASPNFPALGNVGTEVKIRRELVRELPKEMFKLRSLKPVVINSLRIFPGISPALLKQSLQQPLQALVLETYGVGTAPEDPLFIDVIRKAVDQGILIINCSQCVHAKVKMSDYAAGTTIQNAGVISGGDMTVEAAITKLFYLFSQDYSLDEIKKLVKSNLRGELTL